MQPHIRLGTALQNRYRLIKILGQGGFGRTYLAEDQGRFNELCAIKELIPASMANHSWEKSKALFQREASILYQIQHPQVPQFRATFEQEGRLFLVQDYVEGKTYRTLLDERKAVGKTFLEIEILHLLRQLLPVLAHLHVKGIVHRDISLDNIILRASDHKPVLIDFGVVKELATQFQSGNSTYSAITVGKLGYAPSEQIQMGKAYPSSDLYALAVTCIVLLTGREAQDLFDDTQLAWNWQHLGKVNPILAQVLNRMLSYKPGDRFQSVVEVAKALPEVNHQTKLPNLNRQPQSIELSQINTIAVSRPNVNQSNNGKQNHSESVITAPAKREIWDNPYAVIAIGICVALVSGISSLVVVSYLLNQRPVPQTFPSPLISNQPKSQSLFTPNPNVTKTTPSNIPINYTQRLNIAPGENISVQANLNTNETNEYVFSGEQGQQLNVNLTGKGVWLSVLGKNQQPIDKLANRVTGYQGTLPLNGDYVIKLSTFEKASDRKYNLTIRLENPVAPTPTPTPTPTDTPTVDVEPISFNPGETTTQVSSQTTPQLVKRYLLNLEEGQKVSVAVQQGAVSLNIRYPNGQLAEDAVNVEDWQAQIPRTGEYQIEVIPTDSQNTDFTLDVSVRNLE